MVPVHTRGFSNCDLFFDKVYGDDTNHICHFKYFNQFKSFSEISDVLTGKALGRENNKERIIAYNIAESNKKAWIYSMLCLNNINLIYIQVIPYLYSEVITLTKYCRMKYDNGNRNLILKFMRSRIIGGFFLYTKKMEVLHGS